MDDGTPEEGGTFNRDHWGKKAKWTLEAAETLIGVVHDTFPDATLRYVKNYVAISSDGYNRFWLRKRSAGKSLLSFRVDTAKRDEVASIFDAANISYVRRPKGFALTVDRAMLEKNPSLFQAVGRLALKSNDADG